MTRWNTEILIKEKYSTWIILFCARMFALSQFSIKHHHLWLCIARWELYLKSLLPILLDIICVTLLCCELEDSGGFLHWTGCLPILLPTSLYMTVFNCITMFYLNEVSTNEFPQMRKYCVCDISRTRLSALEYNLICFTFSRKDFSEDIWQNPGLSQISHRWITAATYMIFLNP